MSDTLIVAFDNLTSCFYFSTGQIFGPPFSYKICQIMTPEQTEITLSELLVDLGDHLYFSALAD